MLIKSNHMPQRAAMLLKQADLVEQRARSAAYKVNQSRKRKHEEEDALQVLDMKIRHLQARRQKILDAN